VKWIPAHYGDIGLGQSYLVKRKIIKRGVPMPCQAEIVALRASEGQKTAILRAILADYVVSGKISGIESIIAFRAEKENNPVCFGSYSEWEPCPATRRKEWKPACKLCKKLYHIRGDEP